MSSSPSHHHVWWVGFKPSPHGRFMALARLSFSVVRCHFRGVDLPQLQALPANSWFTEASKAIVMCWDGVQKSLFFWDLLWADLFYWSFEFLPKLHMVPLQLKLFCSQNRTKHPMDPPPGPAALRPCAWLRLTSSQLRRKVVGMGVVIRLGGTIAAAPGWWLHQQSWRRIQEKLGKVA